jgi:hypothetical protein
MEYKILIFSVLLIIAGCSHLPSGTGVVCLDNRAYGVATNEDHTRFMVRELGKYCE